MQGSPCLRGGETGSALPSARCRDLQQGSCSDGRAQPPSALPRALGPCVGGSGLEEGVLWGVLVVHRGVRGHGDIERVVPAWVAAGAGVSPAAALKPHQRNR